jgi:hypothetical protein
MHRIKKDDTDLLPPPEDLIKKSIVENEPAKTGAPIAFLKIQRQTGNERREKLNPDNKQGPQSPRAVTTPPSSPPEIAPSTTISDYLINAKEANRLVYCRFGEKYITDLEKRKNSNISSIN